MQLVRHEDAPRAAEHAAQRPLEDLPADARVERRERVVDDVGVWLGLGLGLGSGSGSG